MVQSIYHYRCNPTCSCPSVRSIKRTPNRQRLLKHARMRMHIKMDRAHRPQCPRERRQLPSFQLLVLANAVLRVNQRGPAMVVCRDATA